MPFHADRATLALALEGSLVAAGIIADIALVWAHVFGPGSRSGRGDSRLSAGRWAGSDLLLFLLFILCGVFATLSSAAFLLKKAVLGEDAKLVLGIALNQLGMLLGIVAYHFGRKRLGSGTQPRPVRALRDGLIVFLASLPVVYVVAFLWRLLMGVIRVPVTNQTALDIFINLRSTGLRIAFSILAIAIAPITEELIFRAGLFRFFLGRFPYWFAVLVPAALFGGAHLLTSPLENLPTLGPLIVLGVIFSVAYERTGRVSTTIVAHALFNLNTVLVVLAGINL